MTRYGSVLVMVTACGGTPDAMPDVLLPSDGPTTTIRLEITNRPTDPARQFVAAFQDGDGSWRAAPPPTGNVYELPIASDHYAYAWGCRQPGTPNATDYRQVHLAYFTTDERTDHVDRVSPICAEPPTGITLAGHVLNFTAGDSLNLAWGPHGRAVDATTGAYSLVVEPGTHDLVVGRMRGSVPDFGTDRVAMVREIAVASSNMQDISFADSEPTQLLALPGNAIGLELGFTTAGGTRTRLGFDVVPPLELDALATTQPGDLYTTTVATENAVTAITGATPSVTVPAVDLFEGIVTSSGGILQTTWSPYANAIGYRWDAGQEPDPSDCVGSPVCRIEWDVTLSAGTARTAFEVPDLASIVQGWPAAYQLVPGVEVRGNVGAVTSSVGSSDVPVVFRAFAANVTGNLDNPIDGAVRAFARVGWTVTP